MIRQPRAHYCIITGLLLHINGLKYFGFVDLCYSQKMLTPFLFM